MSFTNTAPAVTCSTATIDPPIGVQVHFIGEIGGTAVDVVTPYVGANHNAQADISAFTTELGPIPYSLHAHAFFGPYGWADSLTASGVLDCHAEPTTTTSSTTSTSSPPSSTTSSTECPDHTLACAGPPVTDKRPAPHPIHNIGTPLTALATTSTSSPPVVPSLAFTGSLDVAPLIIIAAVLIALGALLARRRSVAR